jgi:UDP-glucose 4-epimerase
VSSVKVLVTGGAGYIGSTIALALLDAGHSPILLDDLSRGSAEFLQIAPAYVGDVADRALLNRIFAAHPDIEATVHCAGRTIVTESLEHPLAYYRENVGKTAELVDALLAHRCHRLIFSSSASVYGASDEGVITEESPLRPSSPYARTKVLVEQLLADVCAATPLRALSLRYFNPIGADPAHRSGPYDPRPLDVMGSLLSAAARGEPFVVHGRDWPTLDGTPVRDFVHVWDIARAHVAALRRWPVEQGHLALNLGSGVGTTVWQLVAEFNRIADPPVELRFGPRRPGDIAGGYPSIEQAVATLGWHPERTLADGVQDALTWAEKLRAEEGTWH